VRGRSTRFAIPDGVRSSSAPRSARCSRRISHGGAKCTWPRYACVGAVRARRGVGRRPHLHVNSASGVRCSRATSRASSRQPLPVESRDCARVSPRGSRVFAARRSVRPVVLRRLALSPSASCGLASDSRMRAAAREWRFGRRYNSSWVESRAVARRSHGATGAPALAAARAPFTQSFRCALHRGCGASRADRARSGTRESACAKRRSLELDEADGGLLRAAGREATFRRRSESASDQDCGAVGTGHRSTRRSRAFTTNNGGDGQSLGLAGQRNHEWRSERTCNRRSALGAQP